ncbi:hypothetical protein CAP31_13330 [Sulfuriferula sp. AH1]|uniref:hypothetical protein n=1 Tax=Sulfuriferula sp. AH1 TaxID=1985873 RepID=UPI000B3B4AD8|nr:hypothetical protein [Sulfuriferula sp. AH1]ARU32575.1 hypothetical protein CAP31_13330 [Sulfuriferula sp. AH1]
MNAVLNLISPHLLVYLSVQGVSLACQRRGKFHFIGEFVADEEGYQAFFEALGRFRHAKLSILVDGVDEQYHAESLPHVFGAARAQMLARRLRQVSRDSAYAVVWYQGREDDGRRDDRYLFVSLNTLEWAQAWLDLLAQHAVHLALLTTVPLVSHALVRYLSPESAPLLWVTQQSGGTRLSFFSHNRLLFSRLCTPESSQTADKLAEEIIKTRYYLTSHQYLPHQSPLAVAVLDTQQDYERLCQILNQDTGLDLTCQVRASDVLAQRLRVNASDLHRYKDSLHLAALGRYSTAVNLATPAMTLGYRQMQWRRGLYMAAVACLAAAGLAGGYLSYQRDQLAATVQQTQSELGRQQQRYHEILAAMPATPVAPVELKTAVEAAQTLYSAPQPMTGFAVLSDALAQRPRIAVTRLSWQAQEVDRRRDGGQALYVDGEVHPFAGDYRAALTDIDGLVAELRRHPRVEAVDVISMPINRDPKLSLHQSTQTQMTRAAFKLKLVLRAAS